MSGLEPVFLKAGQAVVVPAVKWWLAGRRNRDEMTLPLSELLNRRITDSFVRRKWEREIEAMADVVAQRLAPLEQVGDMPEHERRAALDAVVSAFARAADSDDVFLGADGKAERLAAAVRTRAWDVPVAAGLSEAGTYLYDRALDECCELYAQTVIHLPSFASRATAELLSRTTALGDQLARLLDRMPVPTLDAPRGTGDDERFRLRYLTHISATLDEAELFGVDVRHFRPRTTLNLAYISLAVSDEEPSAELIDGSRDRRWLPGALRHSTAHGQDPAETGSVRIEQALGRTKRTLLRGEAGSGKTTVLRWLAVNAARGAFTADLASWNDYVPFLVILRRHVGAPLPTPEELVAEMAGAVAGQAPAGWAHRQLASGRALLLVDGVDEVPAAARRAVRDWLQQMTVAYPDIRVVLTSRPAAAAARWLSAEGFGSTMLERMTPTDVRALVGHWHRAISHADDLPCSVEDLPRYENALVARLDANTHLHALATTPLLCAMLCALNLDRRTHLPLDRMSLYTAVVDLLLERRDVEREIPDIAVAGRDKLQLLQYLAGKMSINNETETSRETVVHRLAEKLAAMPQVSVGPAELLEHLLQRSGLLRQPASDRIDFVHRTFQEYLTAREAADRADVGMLVERAHRESWRDVVVMAVGHANARVREDLIEQILDRSDAEPARRRSLRLLAAACLETAPALVPRLLDRVNAAVDTLLPPRTPTEARSVAGAGEPLLRRLPGSTEGLSPAAAAATVRAAALINGPSALDLLTRYAADTRHPVQRELARVWEYFDPQEYATRVLAGAPLEDGRIEISQPQLLPVVRHLRHLRELTVESLRPMELTALDGVPHLRYLLLWEGTPSPLQALRAHAELTYLRIMNRGSVTEPAETAGLPRLEELFFFKHPGIERLDFLDELRSLKRLGLGSIAPITDFGPLYELSELDFLSLVGSRLTDYSGLNVLRELTGLALIEAIEPKHGLPGIVGLAPNLDWLRLHGSRWVSDATPLARLTDLTFLDLSRTTVTDLGPLTSLRRLEYLDLGDCPNIADLSPLASLPRLRYLDLRGAAADLDLSPLAGNRQPRIYLLPGQPVRGAGRLKPRTRLRYLPALRR